MRDCSSFFGNPKKDGTRKKGFSFFSFLRRKERTKQERKVAGCRSDTKKMRIFRNKINSFSARTQTVFCSFRKVRIFSLRVSAKGRIGAVIGGCLLRKCAWNFVSECASLFAGGCLLRKCAWGSVSKCASLFAMGCLLRKCALLQRRFALCYGGCLLF